MLSFAAAGTRALTHVRSAQHAGRPGRQNVVPSIAGVSLLSLPRCGRYVYFYSQAKHGPRGVDFIAARKARAGVERLNHLTRTRFHRLSGST